MSNIVSPRSAPSTISFDHIKRERLDRPPRILLIGTDGVGKTTLASEAPEPLFCGAEDGSGELVTSRIPTPTDPETGKKRWRWEDMLEAPTALMRAKAANPALPFKTFIVDTLDWAEQLVWEYLCRTNNWKSIETPKFGGGFTAALEQWRQYTRKLDELRATDVGIILIAHTHVRTFQNPEGDNYDRFVPKMHEKSAAIVREWVDIVGFLRDEVLVAEKGTKFIGVAGGKKLLCTQSTPAYYAKSRLDMPAVIELKPPPYGWMTFQEQIDLARPPTLRARIEERVAVLDDAETTANVRRYLTDHSEDVRTLREVLKAVESKIAARSGDKKESKS